MKKNIFIVFTLVILTGCINSPAAFPTQIPTETQPPNNTAVSTSIPISATLSPAPTLTQTHPTELVQRCIEIDNKDVSLPEVAKNGTAILVNSDYSLTLLDLQTGNQYSAPFSTKNSGRSFLPLSGISVSPNGNSLAYIEFVQDQSGKTIQEIIWVVDAKGKVLASQTIKPSVIFNNWHWLDNERLELFFSQVKTDGTVALFNPSKNEWQYLPNKLPNFFQSFDLEPSEWAVDYNPGLEWVIYLGNPEPHKIGPIIWDVAAAKRIWQATSASATVNIPKWSPSGNEVAVVVDRQLYRISRSGQAVPLPGLRKGSEIMGFSWSPDGRNIALLVRYDQPQIKGFLMVYSIQSNQVVDYCIEDDALDRITTPIWSPDSKQFFYRITQSNTQIIVDVQQNAAHKIQNTSVLEWMNSLP